MAVNQSSINEPFMQSNRHTTDSHNNTNPILYECNDIILNNINTQSTISIKQYSINLYNNTTHITETITYNDVLSVLLQPGKQITIHTYLMSTGTCCSNSTTRKHKPYTVEFKSAELATQYHTVLQTQLQHNINTQSINGIPQSERQLLVLINPAAGSGKSQERFDQVRLMFEHSGLPYKVIVTTHSQHAYELSNQINLHEFNNIICIGGDGILNEVVNGIMHRTDYMSIISNIAICSLGGGSGNGLCKSVSAITHCSTYNMINSTYNTLKGYTRPIDLFSVAQYNTPLTYGFLSVGWASISDIDLESERYRYCGGFRFTLSALIRLFCINQYNATLMYCDNNSIELDDTTNNKCIESIHCSHCNTNTINQSNELNKLDQYVNDWNQSNTNKSNSNRPIDIRVESMETNTTTDKYTNESWHTLTDKFSVLWCMNVSHAASDMYTAPLAHMSDGYIDLLYTNNTMTSKLLPMFIEIESGKHIHNNICNYIKCRAFKLIPHDDTDKHSEIVIDGERILYQPIEVRCWRGIANILSL